MLYSLMGKHLCSGGYLELAGMPSDIRAGFYVWSIIYKTKRCFEQYLEITFAKQFDF